MGDVTDAMCREAVLRLKKKKADIKYKMKKKVEVTKTHSPVSVQTDELHALERKV